MPPRVPPQHNRLSASNPFRDNSSNDDDNHAFTSTTYSESPTSPRSAQPPYSPGRHQIRPVSNIPVDDAFDFDYDYNAANADNDEIQNGFRSVSERSDRRDFRRSRNPSHQDASSSSTTVDESRNDTPRRVSFRVTSPTHNSLDEKSLTDVTFKEDSSSEHASSPSSDHSKALARDGTVMKRHRWGTQRHKSKPKRNASIFRKRHSSGHNSGHDQDSPDQNEHKGPQLPSSRRIFVNMPLPANMTDPTSGLPLTSYVRNKIRTTKYTPLSFIPKNLFYQFQNIANVFFLFIVILGAFPIFGVESPGMAAVPIIVIVTITAIKDAIEDYRRTVLDMELNNTMTELLAGYNNVNVTDDNVSLWRKFKKANTRLLLRVVKSIRACQAKRKAKKKGLPYRRKNEHELTRTISGVSLASEVSYAMSNLSPPKHIASQGRPSTDTTYRHHMEPKSPASVVDTSRGTSGLAKFKRDYWKNVRVGDFVRVRNNDEIPADMVILATSDSDRACYLETKNLDGETNLKVRQALKCGEGIKNSQDCEAARLWVESEGPMPNLYSYNGVAKWYSHDSEDDDEDSVKAEPISINNILLRGCTLRNTKWVIGVVLFTGADTKIMLNSGVTPTKRSQISRELNLSVITNFVLLFIICFVSGLINGISFAKSDTSIDYFEFGMTGGTPPINGLVTFWAVVVVYQSLVPIALYISIEIVKTIQAFFIYSDCYMYYEPIDYPCTPKSWNISDDLGQIEYIFSDKTGTLTQNVMEFKKCTINGVAYGKAYTEALAGLRKRQGIDVEEDGRRMRKEIETDKQAMIEGLNSIHKNPQRIDDEITFVSAKYVEDLLGKAGAEQKRNVHHFMLMLALCHSVITEKSKIHEGRLDFKAQSPDEAALVSTTRDLGFSFAGRTQRGLLVNVQGKQEEYQILNTLEFNSTRKRMSAIIKFKANQTEDGKEKILLICKGADSVIYSRLKSNEQHTLREQTALHLEEFANEGLRTLCIAERELDIREYNDWKRRHEVASEALTNREERMEEVADSIERQLTLIGGTAIEDRLQDQVPQTIELLGDAGIKLWVLTGDKVETAINIGFSCNLLSSSMELLILKVEEGGVQAAGRLLDEYLAKYFNMHGTLDELEYAKTDHSPPSPNFAVVIDGDSLKLCLEESVKVKFLLLCKQCKSVLCCRVSPAQKASVVRLVKNNLKVMTLSIGDGANDVAMIQEADVGIGIAGEEGRQAVMSSDYAIGQFKFLSRLLLVHGRWSYRRLAEMIPNFFYKNVVFTFTLFWYGVYSSFDSTYLYEYTYVMFFNLAFTSLPVIFMGVLDQDVNDIISLSVPQLYRRGILRLEWTQLKFWVYMFDGLYQSCVAYFFPYLLHYTGGFQDPNGRTLNHRYWMGIAMCTISVMSCNAYILMNQFRWDWLSILINCISSSLVFFWTGIYSSSVYSKEFYSAASEVYGSLVFWAVILIGTIGSLLPKFACIAYQKLFRPLDVDIVRERWHLGDFDEDIAAQNAIIAEETSQRKKMKLEKKNAQKKEKAEMKNGHQKQSIKEWADGKTNGPRDIHPVDTIGSDTHIRFGDKYVQPETHKFGRDADPSLRDYTRRSEDRDGLRRSLDQTRRSLQWEQRPSSPGMDSIRASMELSDLTTADSLMRSMIHSPTKH